MFTKVKQYGWMVLLAFTVLAPRYSSALGVAAIDGNELLRKCNVYIRVADGSKNFTNSELGDGNFCVGYVTGVLDTSFIWQINDTTPTNHSTHFCVPDGLTNGQVVRVIAKWLEDHPARLHERAILLTTDALKEKFSCRR